MKFYGKYLTEGEAREAMSHLYEQGYTREEVKIISNNIADGSEHQNEHNESMWDKIKETFNPSDDRDNTYEKHLNEDEKMEVAGYETNLQAGEVVLLAEERPGHDHDHHEVFNEDLTHDDEKVMELKKEKLNVDKEVQTSEVDVKKVTKQETETVEVPVEKEEVMIERKSASGRKVEDGEFVVPDPYKDEEEIHIPIKEERVNVSKDTVVDNEVVISKEKHKESETVTGDVKHQDIEVEGDSALNEGLKDKNRRSEDI